MGEWTKEELGKAILEVKKKAITDSVFRKLALTDAAAAVKEITGKELPDGLRLKFVENEGVHMTIVLPDMVEGEISEDELDQVAGGTITFTVGNCYVTMTCGCGVTMNC